MTNIGIFILDEAIAEHWRTNEDEAIAKAKEWTLQYANNWKIYRGNWEKLFCFYWYENFNSSFELKTIWYGEFIKAFTFE